MLEDVRINTAIDSLLDSATAWSGGPERGDPSTGSTHRDRFNDWQRRKEEEAKNLLKSNTFHAQFIPAEMLKPRDLNNVGKQSAKMYPYKSLMSA